MSDYLTPVEVSEYLRLNRVTVYRLIKAGTIPAIRVGKSYRIHKDDLAEYIRKSQV